MGVVVGETDETVVGSHETVVRLCYRTSKVGTLGVQWPEHADPNTGLLREESMQMKDLTERGFSVQRTELYSVRDARRAEQKLRERHPTAAIELEGGVCAPVGSIHAIADDLSGQVFLVEPRPKDEDPAHAVVLSKLPRSKLLKYRKVLLASFCRVRPIEELVAAERDAA